jgi:hypothetical protein
MIRTRILLCVLAALPMAATAQDRITDAFHVTLSSAARVGDTTLSPGEYKIKQLPTASSPRMLEFIDKQGKSIRTTISAIPALKNNGADKTVLQFEQSAGGVRYISHLWVEGKSYGYELPAPSDSMSASATTTTSSSALTLNGTSRWTEPPAEVAAAVTPPAPTPQPEPTPEPRRAEPEPEPQPAPAVSASPSPEPTPEPTPAPQQQDRLPSTADRTVAFSFLAGLGFLAVGLGTRTRRRRLSE